MRLAGYALLLGIAFAIASSTGSIPSADEIRDWADGLGPAAPVVFVPLFVVLNFVVAWPILTGAAGLLFGTASGTPVAVAGVTAAALTQMAIARKLARGHHGRLLPKRTRGIERFLERNGAVAVMESRIIPLLPFAVVNYAGGLTTLRYRDMALGTVVGATPKCFAYAALGGSLSDLGAPEVKVAIALIVLLGVAGALLVRKQVRDDRARATDPAPSST